MDLVVIEPEPRRRRHCAECRQGPLRFHTLEFNAAICLNCADLAHLVHLPRGNAALTRRAREASSLWAVVVRRNRRRRRYERQGLLVEAPALARAEAACLADADARARRRARDAARREAEDVRFTAALSSEILRLFPACPPSRASAIATHTSLRGSGRVGRTAAGRALDAGAVTAAVGAAVRHEDTPYDALLMAGVPRHRARAQVRPVVTALLDTWQQPAVSDEPPGSGPAAQ
ncbi:DUF2293 domain-containing protein [Streptomyces chryseus]|uniref:DUF2293 domain-containing protein n=1 Tax=Streptomyces chryseus TaxID=68186 RepID=A0ABQ3DDA9_9ACTN|nr:DUF2293 domain-containing protein [Streptomyces chryseus]GHA83513.1 hypothetical protein GCM10010346_02300 [Streptomyces chryseus]